MSEFKNVTVVREANVYFDGKVTSRTVLFGDGSKKTLGVMLPGEYEFGTGDKEIMEIFSGDLDVLLPGETNWRTITGRSVLRSGAERQVQAQGPEALGLLLFLHQRMIGRWIGRCLRLYFIGEEA